MDPIPTTITNTPPENPASDFNFLRQEGIKYLQQLAGAIWTDHNIHDPGITILDQLCYAITDLSYRIDYDIKELLATETGNPYESLYSPAQVLTVNPVTITDLRKLVIDVEGVKNAWIEKQTQTDPSLYYYPNDKTLNLFTSPGKSAERLNIRGTYRVLIEMGYSVDRDQIKAAVTTRLHGCRNLCEDFDDISILDIAPVVVSGTIEVGQTDDINQTVAGVLFRIARFISPSLRFYTLAEMTQKGKTIDEIFEGPALNHGFIDDDELEYYTRKTELHTSDIIREIMDEPGISYVSDIAIAIDSIPPGQNWFVTCTGNQTPALDLDKYTDDSRTLDNLVFKKNNVVLTINKNRVKVIFEELKKSLLSLPMQMEERDIVPQKGLLRKIDGYYSIQHHFPQVYGIGEAGLPESASPQRKAQANQLKAYLLLYEQILANYYSQTAHLGRLFSFSAASRRTYYCQSLLNAVPGAKEVIRSDKKMAAAVETSAEAFQRKNRLLDHLLARFGESFTSYSLHLASYQSKHPGQPALTDANTRKTRIWNDRFVAEKLVEDKINFLANYPQVSNDRYKAFNYKEESWNTNNISGLEKRIALKLGISNYTRRFLAAGNEHDEEGFHLIEHILLRPVQEDVDAQTPYRIPKPITAFELLDNRVVRCTSKVHGLQNGERVSVTFGPKLFTGSEEVSHVLPDTFEIVLQEDFKFPTGDAQLKDALAYTQWVRDVNIPLLAFSNSAADAPVDPYSLQFTCMFPDWIGRFKTDPASPDDHPFRDFVEKTVREETPVHLTVYIRWLSATEMDRFEKSFKLFLSQLQKIK